MDAQAPTLLYALAPNWCNVMALVVPEPIPLILARFDSGQVPFVEYEVGSDLTEARNASGSLSPERQAGAWAEISAFTFNNRLKEKSVWGTHYGPVWSWKDSDGKDVYAPDLADVDNETIEHWKARSKEVKHPVLRARYADLVWDLSRPAIQQKPDIAYARVAIDSYLETVESGVYKEPIHGIRYVERALALALTVNDKDRIERTRDLAFKLFDKVANPSHTGTWLFLFDNFYGNPKTPLTEEQQTKIIDSLENILRRCCERNENQTFDPWGAQAAAERLTQHYRRANRTDDVHRVTRSYGQAFEELARPATPTLAMGWLQPVYETYRDLGMPEDATRIQVASSAKGRDAASDMRSVTVPLTVGQEEMGAFLEAMTRGSLHECLQRIAVEFVPNVDDARNFLARLSREHPLIAMIGVQRVADGHIAAQAGSVEDDPDGRLILQISENIGFAAPFLASAIGKVVEQHSVSAADLVGFLYGSPVFDPEREQLVHDGLSAYLQKDYSNALHILVPQIEHAFRRLLGTLGLATNKPRPSVKGTMQVKNLGDILADAEIKRSLGEDLSLYWKAFLVDPRGYNVRNRICHGLVRANQLTRELGDRLVHILLTLAMIRDKNTSSY